MAMQIANRRVVDKIDELARLTGLNKTAAIEVAVDSLLAEAGAAKKRPTESSRMRALLAQLDRIPDRPDAFDPLEWDAHGLPR